ncbi:sensor histidine kinase [Streptomyces sp. SP18CS02]|uniref:sensor histidine kinase n=1 Tax=Streptomyces sp. SP18CS02 TaxID=3002531 RepID=UPI002E79D019|nr:sensor histidine kinase [Streptomyces sp. SP18CS02]MEE1756919.1 sensor histidine kinase [Streptomyces sp. SP18CS02]
MNVLVRTLRRAVHSPAYPWTTGVLLTLCTVLELVLVPGTPVVACSVLVSSASLVWRRARPETAIVAVAAAFVGFGADTSLYLVTMVSGLNGWYTLGRHRVQHPGLLIGAGFLASLGVNLVHIRKWAGLPQDVGPVFVRADRLDLGLYAETFLLTVVVLGAVSAGDAVRSREETRRERAAGQQRLLAMERRQAAETERAAIARELHDVVAHSVSVIAVQAESATYTTPDLSPQARDALQQIAGTARSSMTELRRLLGVLRAGSGERAATAPQPTLADLDELLEQHRAVGGRAELRVRGERVGLAAGLELSAYRIVQEALTNARRHAPGAHTVVEVGYRADLLSLRIVDDGPGPPPARTGGHGLAGMRERAALLGGRVRTGGGPEGGFLVEAELPW